MRNRKDCPTCGYNTYRLETVAPQVKIWMCSNCNYSQLETPWKEQNEEYEDIPINRRKTEREIAEKIREELLPKQKIKIRFVKNWDKESFGDTVFKKKPNRKEWWKNPIKFIAIAERNFEKSETNPHPKETFIDTTTHELPHADDEVRFNPEFNPYSEEYKYWCPSCREPHRGVGHDPIWHAKFLNYKGRILKEKFIKQYLKGKK